jgi:proteasome lid subunit RPN8/RPN11
MWTLKKSLLEDLCSTAENYLPDEFMCFLAGDQKKEIITEIVLLPNYSSSTAVMINELNIPLDDTIIGTMHSHPNGSNHASGADKKMFRKYKLNLILGYPYTIENIAFYDEKANLIKITLLIQ